MAKFTKFGYNQYGELVYRNTGRAAPDTYIVRGSTVYGNDGRKVGQIGKGTKTQQATMRKAATAGGRKKAASKEGRFSFSNIRKARAKALKTHGKLQLVTPPPTAIEKKNFGKAVKNMADLTIAQDPALRDKIQKMDDEKLLQLYRDQEMVFDVYFDYGDVKTEDGKGVSGGKQTAKNAQTLIDAYESRFGTIV